MWLLISARFTSTRNAAFHTVTFNTRPQATQFIAIYFKGMCRENNKLTKAFDFFLTQQIDDFRLQSSGCWVVEKHPSADIYNSSAPPGGNSLKPLAKKTRS